MGPCGKTSRPLSLSPRPSLPHPASATFLAEKDASPTPAVTLARFLRASSSRTRSGRSRSSFPLISRSEFHRRRRWPPPLPVQADRSRPGEEKRGWRNEDARKRKKQRAVSQQNSFQRNDPSSNAAAAGRKGDPAGNGRKRGKARADPTAPKVPAGSAKDRGFSTPLRVRPENT